MKTKSVTEIQIAPRFMDQINRYLKNDDANRFANSEDFVERAIEILLVWEKSPDKSLDVFSKMDPTIEQFATLLHTMNKQTMEEYFENFPEEFGKEWKEYCDKNPDVHKKYNEIISESDTSGISNQEQLRRYKHDFVDAKKELTAAKHFVEGRDFKSLQIKDSQEIFYDGWPLLFTHYTRIFPAMIGLFALGESIRKQDDKNRPIVNFEKFKEKAYDISEEISRIAQKSEDLNRSEFSREKRMSTGLPKLPEKTKHESVQQKKYQQRYRDKMFGKVRKIKNSRTHVLDGLLSSLGLIRVFNVGGEYLVTFTEEGQKLYLKENPYFEHGGNIHFSEEERELIVENISQKRKLEMRLIKSALKCIKESKNSLQITDSLDNNFSDTISEYAKEEKGDFQMKIQEIVENTNKIKQEKIDYEKELPETSNKQEKEELEKLIKRQTPIQAIRIATLGRMSELGLVNWAIEDGKSKYSIGKDEFIKKLFE